MKLHSLFEGGRARERWTPDRSVRGWPLPPDGIPPEDFGDALEALEAIYEEQLARARGAANAKRIAAAHERRVTAAVDMQRVIDEGGYSPRTKRVRCAGAKKPRRRISREDLEACRREGMNVNRAAMALGVGWETAFRACLKHGIALTDGWGREERTDDVA